MCHDCDKSIRMLQAVLADVNADGISNEGGAAVRGEKFWDAHLRGNCIDAMPCSICAGHCTGVKATSGVATEFSGHGRELNVDGQAEASGNLLYASFRVFLVEKFE